MEFITSLLTIQFAIGAVVGALVMFGTMFVLVLLAEMEEEDLKEFNEKHK